MCIRDRSTTVDGLGLMATSSKTMNVKAESVTVDGTAYTSVSYTHLR